MEPRARTTKGSDNSSGSLAAATCYRVGDLVVDVLRERVTRDRRELPLAKLSFDLLVLLIRKAPDLVSVESLMEQVWPGLVVGPETVSQRVKLIRDALDDDPKQPRYIAGVRGRGYRLVAPVAHWSGSTTSPPSRPISESVATPNPPARRWAALGASAGVVLLAVTFVWLLAHRPTHTPVGQAGPVAGETSAPSAAEVIVRVPRLAIMPFENLSPDAENAFFADGLHEEILTALAQVAPGLQVISRTTMMTYRGSRRPMSEVARELHATHVMEGSVRREAQHVRLTLQLIDARTDDHVWSQSYDRTLADALTLESDVAHEVAAQLSVRFARAPRGEPLTKDTDAYDLYLKASLTVHGELDSGADEPVRKSEELLGRAILRDPAFAHAYASRSADRAYLFERSLDSSDELLRGMRADVDAARRLAPDDPVTLAAQANYASFIEQDGERALALYAQAERAGLVDVLWLLSEAITLAHMGRLDDAARLCERLAAIDPGDDIVLWVTLDTLSLARRPADAVRLIDREIKRFDGHAYLPAVRAAVIYAFAGRGFNDSVLEGLDRTDHMRAVWLRLTHRYGELKRWLDAYPDRLLPKNIGVAGMDVYAIGDRPVDEFRGWTELLLGDKAEAANRGRDVLQFLSHAHETKYNRWFLRALTAQAYTFMGEKDRAIGHARESQTIAAQSPDLFVRIAAAAIAAQVYAWSGAPEQSVDLLERLASTTPGLSPAAIARDPLYATPLAQNVRYRALVSRLEEQMRQTRLP